MFSKENKKDKKIKKKSFSDFKRLLFKNQTRMFIFILIVVAIYFLINFAAKKANLAQIDFTKDKLYSLTDESKELMKQVSHDTDIYVWGYSEESDMDQLLKQISSLNDKIKYQFVTKDSNPDLVEKYYLDDGYPELIVKSDLKTNYIYDEDTYTYSSDGSNSIIDLKEEKIVNSIFDANIEKKTKVYFVEENSGYKLDKDFSYIKGALEDEFYEVEPLTLISTGSVPEDCDILIIMNVSADFTDVEVAAVSDYINNGGKIFIANDIKTTNFVELPNFQKILDLYGFSIPNKFVSDIDKNTIAGTSGYVIGEVKPDNPITRLVYNSKMTPILLYYPLKIEFSDEAKLNELGVTYNKLVYSSDSALCVDPEKLNGVDGNSKLEDVSEKGEYILGASVEKKISDSVTSKAIVFGSAVSFSNANDTKIGLTGPMAQLPANYNILMNSFNYLADRKERTSIRKTSSFTEYFPTESQDRNVRIAIICIPVIIIGIGIIIWVNRRRRN